MAWYQYAAVLPITKRLSPIIGNSTRCCNNCNEYGTSDAWLFRELLDFAELGLVEVTPKNAMDVRKRAEKLLHFSAEPGVIQPLPFKPLVPSRHRSAEFSCGAVLPGISFCISALAPSQRRPSMHVACRRPFDREMSIDGALKAVFRRGIYIKIGIVEQGISCTVENLFWFGYVTPLADVVDRLFFHSRGCCLFTFHRGPPFLRIHGQLAWGCWVLWRLSFVRTRG